jgi:phosphocarrier protein
MSERHVRIGSKVGLHARPAALFAKAAGEAGVPVRITVKGRPPVDARSIVMLLTLGAEHGDVVTLSAEGEGADAALDSLGAMLERELDE